MTDELAGLRIGGSRSHELYGLTEFRFEEASHDPTPEEIERGAHLDQGWPDTARVEYLVDTIERAASSTGRTSWRRRIAARWARAK